MGLSLLEMKRMFKATKVLLVLAIMAVLVSTSWVLPQAASAQGTVAVVDFERAVSECSAGKKAQLDLRKRGEKLTAELTSLNNEMESLRKEMETSSMLLKPEAKLAKERELERKARALNDRKRDAQQEMGEAERDAFQPILREMTRVIQEIGTKSGYAAIMPSRAVIYYPKSADITAQVIAAYDKLHP